MNRALVVLALLGACIALCEGHGMMMDPVNRASRWRFDSSAPTNYDDAELYCGGFGIQWGQNDGKCGICGDDFRDPVPRRHEFGGLFGEGVIVKSYKQGSTIPVSILLTKAHRGYFYWDLCNMDAESETDSCFEKNLLKLTDNTDKYPIGYADGYYNTTLQIPSGIKCQHCVLRWTYRTGNSWGTCDDGTEAMGCGKQEHFRSCSDISIA